MPSTNASIHQLAATERSRAGLAATERSGGGLAATERSGGGSTVPSVRRSAAALAAFSILQEPSQHQHQQTLGNRHSSSAWFRNLSDLLGWKKRPRNGKVARLPEPLRLRINLMLEDGLRYRSILEKLCQDADNPLPYTLSEMNLSNWFHGGFQDWLKDHQKNEMFNHPPDPVGTLSTASPFSPLTSHPIQNGAVLDGVEPGSKLVERTLSRSVLPARSKQLSANNAK